MNIFSEPGIEDWPGIISRPSASNIDIEKTVTDILSDVRVNGLSAVKKYGELFDGVSLQDYFVTEDEFRESKDLVSDDVKNAIDVARKNITLFHTAQQESVVIIETTRGVKCWRKTVPIEKVGLYVPGGTAPLFSTLLMLGIPATLAGCSNIVVCTPCDKDGKINPAILYTADVLGIRKICKIGGAQAIAAMAYGIEGMPSVYKIFGPGNRFVTCAKQLVGKEGVAIDMPAGPSEVAIYADETCVPEFVAADLLSQAEHGTDSQVLLVASNIGIVEDIKRALAVQLEQLPRKGIASLAIKNSRAVILQNVDAAFGLLNAYAPEHLIIASLKSTDVVERVINAGSVFLGNFSPESAGDYASGTNHTLPTNGFSKAYSGVSLDSFVKKITFQQLSEEGVQNISGTVSVMAAAEGLDAHANAIDIRIRYLNNKK